MRGGGEGADDGDGRRGSAGAVVDEKVRERKRERGRRPTAPGMLGFGYCKVCPCLSNAPECFGKLLCSYHRAWCIVAAPDCCGDGI